MKFARYFASFGILTLVLSMGAFAKDNHSGNFTLFDTVRVGSTELEPGHYKAEWTGSADNVKVDILQNGKTVTTAQGTIKNLGQPSPYTAVPTKPLPHTTNPLNNITFNTHSPPFTLP